ncbi:MAG TPA: 4-hydroxyphenylacetate 3-hydroxylase C-terminal domain-containing protein, partial [Solirubrobacteraceae bacterium]|nr:4-hydroxyphenylacetate 3-hydroxylase C-terminal domain-containing protein [Solirubrobacteraceae bacterium]
RRAAEWVARVYDEHHSDEPGAVNRLLTAPRTVEELRERLPLMRRADMITSTSWQSLMTLLTAAPKVNAAFPQLGARIYRFVEQARARDVRITECITDAKGDRAAPPAKQEDPDAYTRIVERRPDGIVIRGAKLHITGASLGHELLVMPTKRMKAGEEEYAVACAVPVNAPGVSTINTTYAPRAEDDRHFPFTRHEQMPDCFVVFDDVFVPHERVFLDGQVEFSALFAHSLGLWERLGGVSLMATEADTLVGLAQLIAEANGLQRVEHIKEKISELLIYATLIRAGLEAAIAHARETEDGYVYPDELYTNAAKYHGAAEYNVMVRHLHDIAGGGVLTAPTIADLENPDTAAMVEKYMAGHPDVGSEERMRLFHAIRDLTADAFGGWHLVTNVQSGGGLYAQRIVTRKHYDMEAAKGLARQAAGVDVPVAAA